jgi:hypothetical protein
MPIIPTDRHGSRSRAQQYNIGATKKAAPLYLSSLSEASKNIEKPMW